ncbi:MAG: RtcB family protein [Deltaproteobacteria bacterium]|nr:RtcB family protein [Deltaproteobacteria bacterium]
MNKNSYQLLKIPDAVPIKAWVGELGIEDKAKEQLYNVAKMPFIYKHLAVMPDVHWGIGATVGSVIPTMKAIIPAAVGVDIGCGMMAVKTSLKADDLPENLKELRRNIEKAVPHGRSHHGGYRDKGAWREVPRPQKRAWEQLESGFKSILEKHPRVEGSRNNHIRHLGTLGTGNHFIEICLDENAEVWVMLHSGSRGIGNRLGTYFIELAKKDMRQHLKNLPDANLAYFSEGTKYFNDYVEAVLWAQDFARINRELMMAAVLQAIRETRGIREFRTETQAVNCHHNYVQKELHFGQEVWLTRKGAVSAAKGHLGIIPGSMGACSFIVRGKGHPESFQSCSHGAGRVMSRNQAKQKISLDEHLAATSGVECRKDLEVLDESPAAYKAIDKVMAAQEDLVEILYRLKQVVCVKG